MSNKTPPVFLKQERGQTDESLTSERGKTDESLLELRKKSEKKTDDKVRTDREDADLARAKSRSETDLDKEVIRDAERPGSSHEKTQLQQSVDDRINTQRKSDDVAVEAERALMDTALTQERARNSAVASKLLHQERKETDVNLSNEREHTDIEVERTSKLLSKELLSHTTTKAELTTRDEFVAIFSHDLRNPLGAILTCSSMLLKNSANNGITNETKILIELIKRNAETSTRLISDILDMEKVAEGKLQLNLLPHDIDAIISESLENFLPIAATQNVALHFEPSKSKGVVVCDRDRVNQVLSNLIGNALKFTTEGGSITLKVEQDRNPIKVSITDTGEGIPEEHLKRIFERYAQLHDKDRRGLGLGLYISKMFVEAHHGRLLVSSTVGKGSTFSFTLPKQ